MNCSKEFLFCSPYGRLNRTLLKKTIVPLFITSIFFFACTKENFIRPAETCDFQTDNPAGRSYSSDSVVTVNYSKKHCGLLPMSSKNYWVYEDSVFNNGIFVKVKHDTLRYTSTLESLTDKLIWWEGNISVGLPDRLYANDSAIFEIDNRMFTPGIIDAKKDYWLFEGDSLHYLAHFEDNAAQGRSVKMESTIKTPAGSFDEYFLFEKNARNYRRDQVYFKPGLGVLRYTLEQAPAGSGVIKLQQVSTLVTFHIE